MYSYIFRRCFDELIYPNMYQCFINTKYVCACLKQMWYKFEPQVMLGRHRNKGALSYSTGFHCCVLQNQTISLVRIINEMKLDN